MLNATVAGFLHGAVGIPLVLIAAATLVIQFRFTARYAVGFLFALQGFLQGLLVAIYASHPTPHPWPAAAGLLAGGLTLVPLTRRILRR